MPPISQSFWVTCVLTVIMVAVRHRLHLAAEAAVEAIAEKHEQLYDEDELSVRSPGRRQKSSFRRLYLGKVSQAEVLSRTCGCGCNPLIRAYALCRCKTGWRT